MVKKKKNKKMEVKNLLYAGLGIGNKVSKKSYEAYKNFIESGKKVDPKVILTLENFFTLSRKSRLSHRIRVPPKNPLAIN